MNRLTKPTVLVLCISLFSTAAHAQPWKSIKLSNHQIGVNVFQYSDLTPDYVYGFISGKLSPCIGVNYKALVEQQVSFRAYTNYFTEFKHEKSGQGILDAAWDHKDEKRRINLSIGLEQRMSSGRTISSYLFGDIYQEFGKRSIYGYSISHGLPFIYDRSYQYYQLGLVAGAGVKINVIKRLNLNIEVHTRVIREFESTNSHGHFQVYFNPMSRLSLNYRL